MKNAYKNKSARYTYAIIATGSDSKPTLTTIRVPNVVFDRLNWDELDSVTGIDYCAVLSQREVSVIRTEDHDPMMVLGELQDTVDELTRIERQDDYTWFQRNLHRQSREVTYA